MEDFINALIDFDYKELLPILSRIEQHIKTGYLTIEDKIFLEFGFPIIKSKCEIQKKILKGE